MFCYIVSQLGYDGVTCDHDIDECFSAPCENGGSCVNKEALFQCICHNGFMGDVSYHVLALPVANQWLRSLVANLRFS